MGLTWVRGVLGEAPLRVWCLCPAVAGHVFSRSGQKYSAHVTTESSGSIASLL